jgi:hypothetical protein
VPKTENGGLADGIDNKLDVFGRVEEVETFYFWAGPNLLY